MKTFYLNNSSLDYLACSLRYERIVVRGARLAKAFKPELVGGLLVHSMLQRVAGNYNFLHMTMIDPPPLYKDVKPELALKYAMLADRIYVDHPEWFADCRREFNFQIPYTTYEDLGVSCTLAGTMDLLSYDAQEESLTLRDYKSTGKPLDSNLFTTYALKSQPPFYQQSLLWGAINEDNPLKLPSHYIEALRKSRLRFGYVFINGSNGDGAYLAQPTPFVNELELKRFRKILSEKAYLAAALHADPTLAVKEGIFHNACAFCEFRKICALNDDEKEKASMDNWPLGFAPYDPNHRNDTEL